MNEIPKLKPGSHVHLIGICGTAMASLAGLLKAMGYEVTGSDENVYPPMSSQLEELGISIMQGYKAQNLDPKPDLVIVGNVVSRHFEEAQALLDSDIPYTSLPRALGEFVIADRHSIVVAGTHGKTTTTSLLAWLAESARLGAGFLVGGIPENFGFSFQAPQKDWFIIEGDEYDTAFFDKVPKFTYYRGRSVVLTSIEFDHADIYQNLDEIKSVFSKMIKAIPSEGLLVANADDPVVMALAGASCRARVVTYGIDNGDYRAVERETLVGRNQFAVAYKGQKEADIAIKHFGRHNTLNALAAYVLAKELDWPQHKILQGLASFKGVRRRQSLLGEINGIRLVEDFAHHPTAVELTIGAMREQFPGSRVLAIFEPRSATSRRKVFQDSFSAALAKADICFVAPAYDQSKIAPKERLSSVELVAGIRSNGLSSAYETKSVEEIVERVTEKCETGDVILVMSNGGFGGIYQKLLVALKNKGI